MQTPFFEERAQGYADLKSHRDSLQVKNQEWFSAAVKSGYMYQWNWMGIPFIQFPQDIMLLQQIITKEKPTVIIETGIARGGSSAFFASMLHLSHLGTDNAFKVISIDIDIRDHTRLALENFYLRDHITMIEGSSISEQTLLRVKSLVQTDDHVMVFLDSNHTHAHVRRELEMYSQLVSRGQYLVVMDTVIEYLEEDTSSNKPWSKGDNPLTAVQQFLPNSGFTIDEFSDTIYGPTCAPFGYLKRI